MTRKDYRLLADWIKHLKVPPLNRIFLAEHLADMLEKEYSNFKREVFLEHCGVL